MRATAPVGVGAIPRLAGGVATWLPEGRWADPDDAPDPTGAGGIARQGRRAGRGRAADERLRRGRRRVAGARLVRRLAGWPRRVLAAALLLVAVVVALHPDPPSAALGAQPAGMTVVAAARDLPAGTILAVADLRTISLPPGVVPTGTAQQVRTLLGRTVAGPVRRGEVVTDARLVGPELTAGLGPQESAAAPVRLADAEAAAIVRPGDRVDVLGTPVDTAGPAGLADAVELATAVRVLAVLRADDAADGVVLVVAASPATARRLAGAAARHRLTVTVRPP
jgi:Flp pilus assembly protein CpaB